MNTAVVYQPTDIIAFDYYLNDKGQYVFGRVKDNIKDCEAISQSGIFDDSSIELFIGSVDKARRIWKDNSPV
jgi:hypothetical protein